MLAKAIKTLYTLNRAKKLLRQTSRLYRQKEKKLDPVSKERIAPLLSGLERAISQRDSEVSTRIAQQLQALASALMPQTVWDRVRNFTGSLFIALVAAIAIRQMWFEFYTIPTGSMRPTLKEGDYLVVSKTAYGINTPLRSGHFYFDPALVQRGSIVVWTGENMDMPNDSTMHFYLIPGKKQYIKRLIGKPGDTLYFYGGKIYGVSAHGADLKELREADFAQTLEHVPFIRFDGKVEPLTTPPQAQEVFSSVLLYQMGLPVAKLSLLPTGHTVGDLLGQKKTVGSSHYSDLWGFGNYGMARLLTPSQLEQLHPGAAKDLEPAPLYMEIKHHPSLQGVQLLRDDQGRLRPGLSLSTSLLPLQNNHLTRLLQQMTTSRFTVMNGWAFAYGSAQNSYSPRLSSVPDGTYEFQAGKLYKIRWGKIAEELDRSHPLYNATPEQIQLLYNLGIEWQTYFQPAPRTPLPSRYVYFRDGDLYAMGGPIVSKGDPALTLFLNREYQKQSISTSVRPYLPFDDATPPLNPDGSLDVEFVKQNGVTVPEKMYLVLGDNHAMSADSRLFGFVPQSNLRGVAGPLFWPPSDRWRTPRQPSLPLATLPNLAVWSLAALVGSACYYSNRKKRSFNAEKSS
jgi:signal peptidase I